MDDKKRRDQFVKEEEQLEFEKSKSPLNADQKKKMRGSEKRPVDLEEVDLGMN